jgi:DNA-binding NarL/FixJ family response regulator
VSLKLLIFEDNRVYRESLLTLFRYTDDIEVLGAYPDGTHLETALLAGVPDVVLMDIDMPGKDGIETTALLKERLPSAQVVMLTVSEEEERIFEALRNGATGYLLKRTSPEELMDSIYQVHKGGSPMTPAIARKMLAFFQHNALIAPIGQSTATKQPTTNDTVAIADPFADLTPREKEILEGLVDGLSYKMIAARYFIAIDTVKNHIQKIYQKLHVNSKGEAIIKVLRNR